MLEEYIIENTKIKFYDDCIVENTANQKGYIDNIVINLINQSSFTLHKSSVTK